MPSVEDIKQYISELSNEDMASIGGYIEGTLTMSYALADLEIELKEATERIKELQLHGNAKSVSK